MSWKSVLQEYASTRHPERLPPTVRVTHTSRTVAVFDKFNKAKYHILLLPRPTASWKVSDLVSLKKVLQNDKTAAKELLEMLREESEAVVRMIQDEMRKTTGCIWSIHRGFHAIQVKIAPNACIFTVNVDDSTTISVFKSLDHIHLHIISDDLVSEKLKHKKHYNSFHPSLGFFLHLDDVIGWFSLPDAEFRKKASLRDDGFEYLLMEDLRSWRTGEKYSTIPKLKIHLEQEWEREIQKGKKALGKRRREEPDKAEDVEGSVNKKVKSIESGTEEE